MSHAPRGMTFRLADAEQMTGFEDDSIPSLSSLNVAEHFGLGRYGDEVDPDAHVTFMKSLQRVLSPGGRLYFSVPVSDHERVEFNAHRVLSPATVTKALDRLKLVSFSCVYDDGCLYEDIQPSAAASQRSGTGLFEFAKDA
jgi:ubiquinone/menaquinone biosynthesis C-methylase UbiE